MSENTQVQSDEQQSTQSSDAPEQQEQPTKEWTAEQLTQRLSKANAEAKEFRKKAQEMKRQNEELQKAQLAEQGKYKELMSVYQREAEESKGYAAKLKEAFALKVVSDSVTMEAQKLGCVDPEALTNLLNISELPIDETFNVDKNHVKALIEDMKKQKPYFFKSAAPKIPDVVPSKAETAVNPLEKMTLAEKAALLSQLKKQGK